MTADQVLKNVFHLSSFRSLQKPIIDSVLAGNHVLAVLPTGTGKSICFQVPALVFSGTTIVISPLLSLMKDQVDKLTSLGVSATFINSSLSADEKAQRLKKAATGVYQLIYLAPESLLNPTISAVLKSLTVPLVVMDEAHCLAMWGNDFRPEYKRVAEFLAMLETQPRVMALTATATPEVRDEIIKTLKLTRVTTFVSSFKRENLRIWIRRHQSATDQLIYLLRILKKHQQQTGIIYTLTRQAAEEVAEILCSYGYQAEAYHGGMDSQKRAKIQEQFITDEIPIIAATNAFGMGVDKPNIRFVIHFQPSLTVENYYQEIGRAGRDGKISDTYYLFLASDQKIAESLLKKSPGGTRHFHQLKWRKMLQFVNVHQCRQQQLLAYFGELNSPACGQCDYCQGINWNIPETENLRYQQLTLLRDRVAQQFGLQPFQVLPTQAMQIAAIQCPRKPPDLLTLPGIGQGWLNQWSQSFEAYCRSQT